MDFDLIDYLPELIWQANICCQGRHTELLKSSGGAVRDGTLLSGLPSLPSARLVNPCSRGGQARRRWIGGQCEQVGECGQAVPESCTQRKFGVKAAAPCVCVCGWV